MTWILATDETGQKVAINAAHVLRIQPYDDTTCHTSRPWCNSVIFQGTNIAPFYAAETVIELSHGWTEKKRN